MGAGACSCSTCRRSLSPCLCFTSLPLLPPPPQLACARIGAVFSVVFAGFSAESLAGRISDSSPKLVVTCSGVKRGPKSIELKKIVDEVCGCAALRPLCCAVPAVVLSTALTVLRWKLAGIALCCAGTLF